MAAWDEGKPVGKTIILVPHGGQSDYREWRDWFHFGLQKPPGTSWVEVTGLTLTTARTKLVHEALKSSPEYLFWLDDDVIAPNNIISILISHNLPIVCGLYMAKKKKEDRGLAAWMHPQNWSGKDGYLPIMLEQSNRFIQVDVTGLGCALMRADIFNKLSMPWFEWAADGMSEDFYFFEKVNKELGIKPVIDMDMKCDHIGNFKVNCHGEFTTVG